MINIQTLLGDIGIPFWTSGKNVSEGWTTISCVLCGDRSNHGGFSPEGESYSCFRCGKHSIYKIIGALAGYENAKPLILEYSDILTYHEHIASERAHMVEWPPKEAAPQLPSLHAQYLHERGYNPKQIRNFYDIRAAYQVGDFKYRILIPVKLSQMVVTYVGRDVTEKSPLKYKNLSERRSVIPAKECVYNIDNIHETAVICEGIFDAWRFGAHGVALFGIQFTTKQTSLLAKQLKRAFICFDNEYQAQQKAMELGEILSFQGVDVENVVLDEYNDPGDMPQGVADEIKRELMLV